MTLRTRLIDLAARLPFVDDSASRGDEPDGSGARADERAGRERAAAVRDRDGAGDESTSESGFDLVSRPERLLLVLRSNDGRLRQQEIIAETGWSSSTVSRHLRRLEDEGRIVRVLVRGEYLVLLPEADVSPDGVGRGSVTG